MTTFRLTKEDLDGVIRERRRAIFRRGLPFLVGAAIAGGLLVSVDGRFAAFAGGVAATWAYWIIQELRTLRSATYWQFTWQLEDMTFGVDDEGLRFSNSGGSSFSTWRGLSVESRDGYFLVKEELDDRAVLPKRYLSESELLALNSKVRRG